MERVLERSVESYVETGIDMKLTKVIFDELSAKATLGSWLTVNDSRLW